MNAIEIEGPLGCSVNGSGFGGEAQVSSILLTLFASQLFSNLLLKPEALGPVKLSITLAARAIASNRSKSDQLIYVLSIYR